MFKNNERMRDVMLATVIGGLIATIAYVIIFNLALNDEDIMKYVFLFPFAIWVIGYLVIGYGFKWKFGKDIYWVNTLCSLPCMFEIIVVVILGVDFMDTVIKWYSMIGLTISVLIFEYKFMTHGKK